MHLGMTGRFRVEDGGSLDEPGSFYLGGPAASVHDHVVFHMEHGARVTYNDARRFGFMSLYGQGTLESSAPFAAMGVEPLGTLTGDTLAALFRGRRTPLKAALLDQRLVAGLGNIYVCEALHRARLSPETPAGWLVTAARPPAARRWSPGNCHPGRARGSDRGRWLNASRPRPGRRLDRGLSGTLSRLRSRGRGLPSAGLQRHRGPLGPVGTFDVPLSGVSGPTRLTHGVLEQRTVTRGRNLARERPEAGPTVARHDDHASRRRWRLDNRAPSLAGRPR